MTTSSSVIFVSGKSYPSDGSALLRWLIYLFMPRTRYSRRVTVSNALSLLALAPNNYMFVPVKTVLMADSMILILIKENH